MDTGQKTLAVVVPCYNEEEVLPDTFEALNALLDLLVNKKKVSAASRIYFVDDGSTDRTWDILLQEAAKSKSIVAVKLSRNKGHQNALFAGLWLTTEDMVVSIDADLQDDPSNIEAMVDHHLLGSEVVYGVRSKRSTDTVFKRLSAEGYYSLMRVMGVDLVFNHADFRLMSRRAVDALKEYQESNLFLRGVVREIGFPSSEVAYERKLREAGESKYPLRKMLSFAWDGVTSFSTIPLRFITILGVLSSIVSLFVIVWVVAVWLLSENAVPGWASILIPLLMTSSVQLLSLGVVGEYMAKLYKESKRRPRFHISEVVGIDASDD